MGKGAMMTGRKLFIRITAIGMIVILAVVAYYAWVLYSARRYTVETILPRTKVANYPLGPSALTSRQLEILLKVEDPRFFQHDGVDFSTPGAGITTITQGLVKILYFDKFKPGIAKIKQTLIARYVLDPLMSKEDQLRLFINTVSLGKGAKGFEQSANIYFNKPFNRLTEDEYIALVAMIISPVTFNMEKFPDRNSERVQRIKRLVSGAYKPRGLLDVYYGPLDVQAQSNLPSMSYFKWYYD